MSRRMSISSPNTSPPKKSRNKKKRDKVFHLVLNEREKNNATSLRSMKTSKLMKHNSVPGIIKPSCPADRQNARLGEFTRKGRRVVPGMKNLICLMHKNGLTLSGDFSLKNLAWVSGVRQVKFRRISDENFQPVTPEGRKLDFEALAKAVELLLNGCNLPEDLKDWIDLLKHFEADDDIIYLIKFHVALMSGPEKVKHFIQLYSLLEQVRLRGNQGDKDSESKYRSIVKTIFAGSPQPNSDWRDSVSDNKYLKMVYYHRRDDYTKGGIGSSVLLLFVRNCTQHLMDKSVVGAEIKFRYGHISWMIDAAFPNLCHQFQRAMVWAGLEDKDEH